MNIQIFIIAQTSCYTQWVDDGGDSTLITIIRLIIIYNNPPIIIHPTITALTGNCTTYFIQSPSHTLLKRNSCHYYDIFRSFSRLLFKIGSNNSGFLRVRMICICVENGSVFSLLLSTVRSVTASTKLFCLPGCFYKLLSLMLFHICTHILYKWIFFSNNKMNYYFYI